MKKNVFIAGDIDPFLLTFKRVFSNVHSIHFEFFLADNLEHFGRQIRSKSPGETMLLLNTVFDTASQVNFWVWRYMRLNEKMIGKEAAGIPVIVFGWDEEFLETQEGSVFRDFPMHHKYLTKPFSTYRFLLELGKLCPINPHSLCVIKGNAPDNMLFALEHSFANILQRFDFTGSDEDVKKKFLKIETDFEIYSKLGKSRTKHTKLKEELLLLKKEIVKKRGQIWQKIKF